MQIAIIGTGYVGLVTGTCFAETGNRVTCVDVDKTKVDNLNEGVSPIYEPGLDVLLDRNIKERRIKFTTSLSEGIENARVIFLALPTPPGKDGSADLQYVVNVAGALGRLIKNYTVIVNKSTVPVGTAEKVSDILAQYLNRDQFDVVSNPEFLREGVAVDDFLKPDRVVVGTSSAKARQVMDELYQPFVRQGNPIYYMDERSAEMTKYAANSYLAMRISFMNEMANLCEKTGANVDWVRIGMGADSRIGKRFLFPGIGYGGSCFPKDIKALAYTAAEANYDFQLVNAVMRVNDYQKYILAQKVKDHFGRDLTGLTFALWGLAFKPETDDIRDAPSLEVIRELTEAGATIKVYDPEAMNNVRQLLGDQVHYARNQYDALEGAHAMILVTEWSEFRNPDFERIFATMKYPVVFDGRNVYTLEKMQQLGFYYHSIGRHVVNAHVLQSIKIPQREATETPTTMAQ